MTDQSTDMERELRDLREENELLLLQLHQVQEELESYYLRNLELERRGSNSGGPRRSLSVTAVASEDTLRRLQRRYEEIRDSTFWRLTRPIRVVMRVLLRKGKAPSPPGKHAPLSERACFYERRVKQLGINNRIQGLTNGRQHPREGSASRGASQHRVAGRGFPA